MKIKKTRAGRALALWVLMFLATVLLVALPTGFAWPYWLYGLIWGVATTAVHYGFRRFFEQEM